MTTVTLHWVHQRAGAGLRTACGLAPVKDLADARNAGHGGPCPACTKGISRDEWTRLDHQAWTAYLDGRTISKENRS